MELEALVHCLIEILTDHGTLKTYITTENESKLYNVAELKVINMGDDLILKIEGMTQEED